MGVLPCARNSCENIMCDTYIPEIGYICNDCKREFINNHPEGDVNFSEIRNKLDGFMSTAKRELPPSGSGSIDDFFNYYTKD